MANVYLDSEQNICISGDVYYSNVVRLRLDGERLINQLLDIHVNLCNLTHFDSSILLLMSAWIKAANQQNKKILVYNIPRFLSQLSRVCGLDDILPIKR